MTYEEAKAKALTVEWVVKRCLDGKSLIKPTERIMFKHYAHMKDWSHDLNLFVDDALAAHIVKLHNDSLKKQPLLTDVLVESEEVLCSPIRFDGVHVNKIKAVFAKYGIVEEDKF